MPRLFLAVDLAISVVERLAVLQREWSQRIDDEDVRIKWVDPANIHVTLKFLGETEKTLVPMLEEVLADLARPLFPFEVSCQRVGAFPNPRRARILWAGLDPKGAEVMALLPQAIERDLEPLGFARDAREFHPHVTLGRVKSKKRYDMSPIVDEFADFDFGQSYVKDIILYESTLTRKGAEYTVLNRFPLGDE
jgi:2'-5' RNA ligase